MHGEMAQIQRVQWTAYLNNYQNSFRHCACRPGLIYFDPKIICMP